jgi:hypothetical protein
MWTLEPAISFQTWLPDCFLVSRMRDNKVPPWRGEGATNMYDQGSAGLFYTAKGRKNLFVHQWGTD